MSEHAGTIAARYETLVPRRKPYLDRARSAAKLTIPALMVPEGHNDHSTLPTPYQGMGARGVNNLAAKLLLSLLPPNAPFFRFRVEDEILQQFGGQQNIKTEIETALAAIERSIAGEIEVQAIRVPGYDALRQLLVSGNVLLNFPDEGGMRVFRLDSYVINRDNIGNVLEIITKEFVSKLALEDEVVDYIEANAANPSQGMNTANVSPEVTGEKDWCVYTYIRRERSRTGNVVWRVSQEIGGVEVPGTRATYPIDKLPWLALRYQRVDGESYGRGQVEEFLGDLRSLEGLTRAIIEGAAAAAKVLFLVNPSGTTKKDDVSKSPNGAVREGRADDVSVMQMQKYNDFRVALETANQITERLNAAFLLNSSVQRNAERVTAEEIRFVAAELQDALGGVYAILSQEFQLPLVRIFMERMQRQKRLRKFPKIEGKEVVRPLITTGLEALGRGQDLNKLRGFAEDIAVIGQADASLLKRLNSATLLERMAAARGVDTSDLILTDEQFAALQAQEQMQQMMQQATGPVAGAVAQAAAQPQPEQ